MKKILKITLVLALLLPLSNCSDDIEEPKTLDVTFNSSSVTGILKLPEASPIDADELTVQTFFDKSAVVSGSYTSEVSSEEPSFMFVADNNGKVVLLNYYYPGKQTTDISPESTVAALVMSLPITSIMTDNAKINFIQSIKSDPNFPQTVELVEAYIQQGISPLDVNDTRLMNEILSLVSNSLSSSENKSGKDGYDDNPVNIITAGNTMLFQNAGKFYASSVGIYKDGVQLKKLMIPRIQFFANSASEAFQTANNIATNDLSLNIEEESFPFSEDGTYEIRIRSGMPYDGSPEESEAFIENLKDWTLDVVLSLLPLKGKAECVQQIGNEIRSYLPKITEGVEFNSAADGIAFTYDVTKSIIEDTAILLKCTPNSSDYTQYLEFAKKLFSWDAIISKIGTAGNLSLSIGQLLFDKSSMDLCYQVADQKVSECDFNYLGYWLMKSSDLIGFTGQEERFEQWETRMKVGVDGRFLTLEQRTPNLYNNDNSVATWTDWESLYDIEVENGNFYKLRYVPEGYPGSELLEYVWSFTDQSSGEIVEDTPFPLIGETKVSEYFRSPQEWSDSRAGMLLELYRVDPWD